MQNTRWIKWVVWLIAGLLVANILTLYLLYSQNNKVSSASAGPTEMYVLEGEDSGDAAWKIENYKIIKSSNASIWRGSGQLTYLGNEEDVEDISYVAYTFYEQQDGHSIGVLASAHTAEGGSAIQKVTDVGSISGDASIPEQLSTREDIELSYLEIEWKDHLGKMNKEKIELMVKEYVAF
ncbi:hypothetical protein SAMN05661091_5824 [Paenibacillus uliginis N3/975]|uniref:Uncharacterized protein n=1 Tax=Paenibacillus uliginis N3/975 TaxID=1313296 RepID=A0A1X7HV27_9BACL|nr:hypothetical protein [Paenibacillus uliginis]SMF92439.1 hypothetical protein SAMN05661091_5824 [Paenibacillus uliginis N3/975]